MHLSSEMCFPSIVSFIPYYFTGGQAFDDLETIISTLVQNGMSNTWGRQLQDLLRTHKRYLKTDFKVRVVVNLYTLELQNYNLYY